VNGPVKPLSPRARFVASASGTFIEWYDFFIYGSLATVLAVKFFPQTDPAVALLATLAGLGAGFVMRPIGAVFFGWLGDRRGRKKTFISTLIIMGVSTALMGLIPTYESIGITATVPDLEMLGPVLRMSETTPRWSSVTPRLGSSLPRWL